MRDRREELLARLEVVLNTIVTEPPIKEVVRNRGEMPDKRRPALVLLDADEIVDISERGRGRPANAPNLVTLQPQIFLLVGNKPENEMIGQHLNQMRIAILNAILNDDDLTSIVGTNGEIRYGGCATDLATGRAMQGEMQISVLFTYVLHPSELV